MSADNDATQRLMASVAGAGEPPALIKPARRSRNSIFSQSWVSHSPVVSSRAESPAPESPLGRERQSLRDRSRPPPSVRIEAPPSASTSKVTLDSPVSPVSPGSSAKVEAWDSIKTGDLNVPASPHLVLRTIPTRPHLLGVGRHAAVYLAACRDRGESEADWKACAAKRMQADRESQLAGFREAFVLAKLYDGGKGPKSIIRLLALRDERDADGRGPHRSDKHARSNSESADMGTFSAPVSPEMARAGSQSNPTSPIVAQQAKMGLVNHANSNVRRAVSMRETPTSPTLSARRVEWEQHADGRDPPRLVLVLELCEGGNLSSFLQTRSSEAVAHAHSMGFMHADVKPGNVMLTEDLDVRLADWGMSLPIAPDRLPTEGIGLGTTLYCAPEMVQPSCPFGFPADIYSLGVTLSVLLSGREPFRDARSPVEQMLWVSRGKYWEFEERYRLSLIGASLAHSVGRATSIGGRSLSENGGSRPPSRVGSIRSLRSLAAESISDQPQPDLPALFGPDASRETYATARIALANAGLGGSWDLDGPTAALPTPTATNSFGALYSDGSPLQFFLDGREPVPEGVRLLLQRMTLPNPDARPTAQEVVNALAIF